MPTASLPEPEPEPEPDKLERLVGDMAADTRHAERLRSWPKLPLCRDVADLGIEPTSRPASGSADPGGDSGSGVGAPLVPLAPLALAGVIGVLVFVLVSVDGLSIMLARKDALRGGGVINLTGDPAGVLPLVLPSPLSDMACAKAVALNRCADVCVDMMVGALVGATGEVFRLTLGDVPGGRAVAGAAGTVVATDRIGIGGGGSILARDCCFGVSCTTAAASGSSNAARVGVLVGI
jgi:hypothetical protein